MPGRVVVGGAGSCPWQHSIWGRTKNKNPPALESRRLDHPGSYSGLVALSVGKCTSSSIIHHPCSSYPRQTPAQNPVKPTFFPFSLDPRSSDPGRLPLSCVAGSMLRKCCCPVSDQDHTATGRIYCCILQLLQLQTHHSIKFPSLPLQVTFHTLHSLAICPFIVYPVPLSLSLHPSLPFLNQV